MLKVFWLQFPISILQNSVKMVTGLPDGLKHRLNHSFLSEPVLDEDFFYGCPGKDRALAKLIYSLSFLHATALERRKYGPIGWNLPYNFTEDDFHISLYQLKVWFLIYLSIFSIRWCFSVNIYLTEWIIDRTSLRTSEVDCEWLAMGRPCTLIQCTAFNTAAHSCCFYH